MKKEEVRVGSTYSAKVSGHVVAVRITEEKWAGDKHVGWIGLNTKSGRPVRMKSAQKLRAELNGTAAGHTEQQDVPAPAPKPDAPAKPKGKKAKAPVAPDAANFPTGDATAPADAVAADPAAAPTDAPTPAVAEPRAKGAKKAKAPKPPKPEKVKRLSCIDAAAQVLKKAGKPMKAKEMIEAMGAQGLWSSPAGKTPEASLYAAIIREIAAKKKEARFKKTERGTFTHSGVEAEPAGKEG